MSGSSKNYTLTMFQNTIIILCITSQTLASLNQLYDIYSLIKPANLSDLGVTVQHRLGAR